MKRFTILLIAAWVFQSGFLHADEGDSDASVGRSRSGVLGSQSNSPVPRVSYEDLVLLVKNARRSFRGKIMGTPERSAGYHPPALDGMRGIVHLTLRSHGAVVVEAQSPEMGIVDASVAAGTLLGQAMLDRGEDIEERGDAHGIEFEWLGPREYLNCKYYRDTGGQWTEELLHSFEPAAEGIGIEFRGQRGWTRPAEIVSRNYSPDLALQAAEAAVDLKHSQKLRFVKDIKYFRFWAYHLWQPSARELPVVLLRGETLVTPEAVTASGIDAAIDRMGSYLDYRQNSNGAFSHEYLPNADRYGNGNSARVQLRALDGLADYAAWTKKAKVSEGVHKGIDSFDEFLEPLLLLIPTDQGEPQHKPAGLALMPAGHKGHLELSARMLSAMTSASRLGGPGGRYSRQIDGLIEGLLASQDAEGRMAMAFERDESLPVQDKPLDDLQKSDSETGWALLALADAYARLASEPGGRTADLRRIDQGLRRGLDYVRRQTRAKALDPLPAAAAARAFALHYVQTNDARLSDFVFEVADYLASRQVRQGVSPYPELYGAINVRRPGLIGSDTAVYLSTLADALALAKRVGDRERTEQYRRATLAAVRFLLQLEFSKVGCYYIRTPLDAMGGVRRAPWDCRIRADHCASAVTALCRARLALYGELGESD